MNTSCIDQVRLLVNLLPIVDQQTCFALKGGTAINLFLRNMPRLSVDIDLAYLPVQNWDASVDGIDKALGKIVGEIEKRIPHVQVTSRILKGSGKRRQADVTCLITPINGQGVLIVIGLAPGIRKILTSKYSIY